MDGGSPRSPTRMPRYLGEPNADHHPEHRDGLRVCGVRRAQVSSELHPAQAPGGDRVDARGPAAAGTRARRGPRGRPSGAAPALAPHVAEARYRPVRAARRIRRDAHLRRRYARDTPAGAQPRPRPLPAGGQRHPRSCSLRHPQAAERVGARTLRRHPESGCLPDPDQRHDRGRAPDDRARLLRPGRWRPAPRRPGRRLGHHGSMPTPRRSVGGRGAIRSRRAGLPAIATATTPSTW